MCAMPALVANPNIWDILTSIGTVGAVVVALAFGVRAERRLVKNQRSGQASLVSAWLQTHPLPKIGLPVKVVVVRNGSALLIYDVRIHHHQPDQVQSPMFLDIVPPGEDREMEASHLIGDPWTIPFDLEFTDAAGRTWLRKSDGRLIEQRRNWFRRLTGRKARGAAQLR